MSVLIKGMQLPESCIKCILHYKYHGQYICTVLRDPWGDPCQIPIIALQQRQENCPLEEKEDE